MTVHIGLSGWQYKHWRERFYPKGVAQKKWLEFYAERFHTVESNNAFYMLPKAETFQAWAERTPDDFIMAVKANRYLTHIRRLKESAEPVERFLANATKLGPKLGPVLLQLPPNLKIDLEHLDETLRNFGGRVQVAVEFRHDTWFVDETKALLEEHKAALCMADRLSRPITELWRTVDWSYLRFHEGVADPHPCYGRQALRSWAKRLAEMWGPDEDVWVYFNNDAEGCALRDAKNFARDVETVGRGPTRVMKDDVPVGYPP
ncbi:MAG: DUF72 domain-containing protein [Actinomycetota bacterium]|nr:DUF72 domain-containing protein [Actinomycetota bacterium]